MRLRRTAALLVAGLALVGCSDDQPVSHDRTPADVMALAKRTLDETSGVRITLQADQVPEGASAVVGATGVGTHPAAFEGTLTVALSGNQLEVPIVAVAGKVFAQIPLTPGWSDVDPADYGAPDPAQLMSTDSGLSSLLTATRDLAEGDTVRGGADNSEVLTEFTGTVPGAAVGNVIPTASGDFEARYTITAGGELRGARLTGAFYPGADPITYTLGFEEYGIERDITAP